MAPRLKHLILQGYLGEPLYKEVDRLLRNSTYHTVGGWMMNDLWKRSGLSGKRRYANTQMDLRSKTASIHGCPTLNYLVTINYINDKERDKVLTMIASADKEIHNLGITIRYNYWYSYWNEQIEKYFNYKHK